MSEEELPKDTKIYLALALAQGYSAAKWARAHGVPKNTAYRWAREPEVRKAIQAHRRRLIDEAVGKMTKNTSKVADVLIRLARDGDSHSIQLRAARAVYSDLIALSKYSDLEERMTEVEVMQNPEGTSTAFSAEWVLPGDQGAGQPPIPPPTASQGAGNA
jgi:transposase-like protein